MLISPSHLQAAVRLVSTFMIPSRYAHPHSLTVTLLLAASGLSCGSDDPSDVPAPSTIVMIAGNDQVGRVSQELPDPLVVRVLDQSGNRVPSVNVTWAAQGGGSVSPETVLTDSEGIAEARRFLGPTIGNYTTTAAVDRVEGSLVTFTSAAVDEGVPLSRLACHPHDWPS
jgi:hypothetical protein